MYDPQNHINQLKYLLAVLIIIFLLTVCSVSRSYAIEPDKAAHLGVSYALTTVTYGFYKSILNKDCRLDNLDKAYPGMCQLKPAERLGAASFAAVTIFFMGLVKEMTDKNGLDKSDVLYNGLGVLGATGSIILFKF